MYTLFKKQTCGGVGGRGGRATSINIKYILINIILELVKIKKFVVHTSFDLGHNQINRVLGKS